MKILENSIKNIENITKVRERNHLSQRNLKNFQNQKVIEGNKISVEKKFMHGNVSIFIPLRTLQSTNNANSGSSLLIARSTAIDKISDFCLQAAA